MKSITPAVRGTTSTSSTITRSTPPLTTAKLPKFFRRLSLVDLILRLVHWSSSQQRHPAEQPEATVSQGIFERRCSIVSSIGNNH